MIGLNSEILSLTVFILISDCCEHTRTFLMAGTRISECLPPLIDPSRAPVAFGKRALPRLMTELQAEEQRIRQGALCSLCDLLHDPEQAYEALHHGTDVSSCSCPVITL